MVVQTSEFVDWSGALCQDGDGDFQLRDPGDPLGSFTGQADHRGITGTYSGMGMDLPLNNDS
ncbi:MAG: hypothetical protein P8J50_14030 [Acidimicrobiales bacterium]|jgi:hypothetical protein|nr:hypothetical protein [Acidimicrobiales bacterium]